MLICISILIIAFVWLFIETNNLSVRLPYGKAKSNEYINALIAEVTQFLALPEAKQSSYFIPCDLNIEDLPTSKTIVNVGAKILV